MRDHLRKFGAGALIAFTVKGFAATGLIAFAAAKSMGLLRITYLRDI
jgi:hypothetical protein